MFLENAIEVPHKPDVKVLHANIVELSGNDTARVKTGIRSIVNGTGNRVGGSFGRETLLSFTNGIGTTSGGNKAGVPPEDEVFNIPAKLF